MLAIKLERDLNPPDHADYEACNHCGKDLLISNNVLCPECAESHVLDLARENKTFLREIIAGEYLEDSYEFEQCILYAWESNDSDRVFDAVLDAFSGAVLSAMEGKV